MDVLCGIFIAFALQGAWARKGYGPGEQEWGHVTVREGAHMFYWLYYVQDDNLTPADVPTIVWLEGPGVDSTGFSNFGDIGPLLPDGKTRDHSWVKKANLLFIDNPVGVGYSYVEDLKFLSETRDDVANDMVTLVKNLLEMYPVLKQSPFYFFGRCYGSTMGMVSAIALDKAVKNGEIEMKMGSIILLGGWIYPMLAFDAYANILAFTGMVNEQDEVEINQRAEALTKAIQAKETKHNLMERCSDIFEYMRASTFGREMFNTIFPIPFEVDFADNPVAAGKLHHPLPNKDESLALMRSEEIRDLLGIEKSVEFSKDAYEAAKNMAEHIFSPNAEEVTYVLDSTDMKVFVVFGQFNSYFNAIGARNSITSLEWSGADEWKAAPTKPFISDGILNGYSRSAKNLHYLVIDRAGHMIPTDNPSAGAEILRYIIDASK